MIIAKGKKHCISYMVFLEHKVVVTCPYVISVTALMVIMTLPHPGQVTNGEAARVRHRH